MSAAPLRLNPLPALVSFDVFGTLIDVRQGSYDAFAAILKACHAPAVDVKAFWEDWEHANIRRYWEPYRPYREIVRDSLAETFGKYGVQGDPALIQHYFDAFPRFKRFPDVDGVLDAIAQRSRIAVVSNIDDDLLALTPLGRTFDLVCTAQRAKGYKPDGALFRYLLAYAECGIAELLHCGQSQHTDMVGAKPLGIRVAWINRRSVALATGVPTPDYEFSRLAQVQALLGLG
ncbi:MAG TPA: HAD hydrolase-like protein [bacterium]